MAATRKVNYLVAKSEEERVRHEVNILRDSFSRLQETHARYKFYQINEKKWSVDLMKSLELKITAAEKNLREKIGNTRDLYAPAFESVDDTVSTLTVAEEYEEIKSLLVKQLKVVRFSIDVMTRKARDIQYEIDNSLLMDPHYRKSFMEMMITHNERVAVLKEYQRKLHKQMTALIRSFPLVDPNLKLARIKEYWHGEEALLISMRASMLQAEEEATGISRSSTNFALSASELQLLESIQSLEEEKRSINRRTRTTDRGKLTTSLLELELKIAMAKVFYSKMRCLSLTRQFEVHLRSKEENDQQKAENHAYEATKNSISEIRKKIGEEFQSIRTVQFSLDELFASIPMYRRKMRRMCAESISSAKSEFLTVRKDICSKIFLDDLTEASLPVLKSRIEASPPADNSKRKSTSNERRPSRLFSMFSTSKPSLSSSDIECDNNKSLASKSGEDPTVDNGRGGDSFKTDIDLNLKNPIVQPRVDADTEVSNRTKSRSKSINLSLLFNRSVDTENSSVRKIDEMLKRIRVGLDYSAESLPAGVTSMLFIQEEIDNAKYFCQQEENRAFEQLRKIPFFHIGLRNQAHEEHLAIVLRARQLLELSAKVEQVFTQYVLPAILPDHGYEQYYDSISAEVHDFVYVLGYLQSQLLLLQPGRSLVDASNKNEHGEQLRQRHARLESDIREVLSETSRVSCVEDGIGHVYPYFHAWNKVLQIRRDIQLARNIMLPQVVCYKRTQRLWNHVLESFEEAQIEDDYWAVATALTRCAEIYRRILSAHSNFEKNEPFPVFIHEELEVEPPVECEAMQEAGQERNSSVDSAEDAQLSGQGFGSYFRKFSVTKTMTMFIHSTDVATQSIEKRQKLRHICEQLYAISLCPIPHRPHIVECCREHIACLLEKDKNRKFYRAFLNDNPIDDAIASTFSTFSSGVDDVVVGLSDGWMSMSAIATDAAFSCGDSHGGGSHGEGLLQNIFTATKQRALHAYYRVLLRYQYWNRIYLQTLSEIQAGTSMIEDFGRVVSIPGSGYHRKNCSIYEFRCLCLLHRLEQYERLGIGSGTVGSVGILSYATYREKICNDYKLFLQLESQQKQQQQQQQQHQHSNRAIPSNMNVRNVRNSVIGKLPVANSLKTAMTSTLVLGPEDQVQRLRRINNGLERNRNVEIDASSFFSSVGSATQSHLPLPPAAKRFWDGTLSLQELGAKLFTHMNFDVYLYLLQQQQQDFLSKSIESDLSQIDIGYSSDSGSRNSVTPAIKKKRSLSVSASSIASPAYSTSSEAQPHHIHPRRTMSLYRDSSVTSKLTATLITTNLPLTLDLVSEIEFGELF
jgi:hypothetical protein